VEILLCVSECSPGYFGSYCQFQCLCDDDMGCDRVTGECASSDCDDDHWGVGCMLGNNGITVLLQFSVAISILVLSAPFG
jgi:hypothetical protein